MDVWRENFEQAEEICRRIFADALANRALLSAAATPEQYKAYRVFDIRDLQAALTQRESGATHYLILGRIRPNDAFDPAALVLMFHMAGDFHALNNFAAMAVASQSSEPLPLALVLPAVRALDRILFDSRMLAEMFRHAAAIAATPGLSDYARVLAGTLPREHYSHEQLMRLELRHSDLVAAYRDALMEAEQELRHLSLDPVTMAERLNQYHDREQVIWTVRPPHPGARTVNGVWIPHACVELLLGKHEAKPSEPKPLYESEEIPVPDEQVLSGSGGPLARTFRYRINRTTYWLMLVIALALAALLGRFGPAATAASVVLFLYVSVPRLHDIGRSGWIAVAVLVPEIVIGIAVGLLVPAPDRPAILGVIGMVVLGLQAILGCIPGNLAPNRWGKPPAKGLSFSSVS